MCTPATVWQWRISIFSVVFGHYAKLPSDDLPYPVFAYAGLAVWTYASTSVTAAAQILVTDRSLVTRIYFPRILTPIAAVLSFVVDLVISFAIVVVAVLAYGYSIELRILAVVPFALRP